MKLELVQSYSVAEQIPGTWSQEHGDITSAEYLCEYAARVCYDSVENMGTKLNFLSKKIVQTGHHSVLEHFRFVVKVKAVMGTELFHILNTPGVYTVDHGIDEFFVSFSLRHFIIWEEMLGSQHKWVRELSDIIPPYAPCIFTKYTASRINMGNRYPVFTEGNTSLIGYNTGIYGANTGSITVLVDSVSRAFSHQIVRHRLFSFSQQSLRYVEMSEFKGICPKTVEEHWAESYLSYWYDECSSVYTEMLDQGVPKEDARFVLPIGTETKMVITMPYPGLKHFLNLRLHKAAQWEIGKFAENVLKLTKKIDKEF